MRCGATPCHEACGCAAPCSAGARYARPGRWRRSPARPAGQRTPSSRVRAMTGMKGPLGFLALQWQALREAPRERMPSRLGSASTTASGSTAASAAGASAQLASMIGKAPAARRAVDDIQRRVVGNDDKRTLQRHGLVSNESGLLQLQSPTIAKALLMARQRPDIRHPGSVIRRLQEIADPRCRFPATKAAHRRAD